ncbi:MAG: hypothetical protein NTZ16_04685 [Verrucomicrobia bacterium]|nr:hypothetical protein [Verrucomicrobiota bacterium]
MVDLSKGLFVENFGLLIPWGVTNEEAWQIGNPTPWNLPDDKTRMKWDKAVILDGMECVIQTYFPTAKSKLSEFYIHEAHYEWENRCSQAWAETLKIKCENLFGQQNGDGIWRQNNVTLAIVYTKRFEEACWLEIVLDAT